MSVSIPELFLRMRLFRDIDPLVIPPRQVSRDVVRALESRLHPRDLLILYAKAMWTSNLPTSKTAPIWKDLGKQVIRSGDKFIIYDPEHKPSSRISVSNAVAALNCPVRAFIDYHSKTMVEIVDADLYRKFLKGLLFHRWVFERIGGNVEGEVGYRQLWGRVDSILETRIGGKRVLAVLEAKSTMRDSYFTKYYFAQVAIYAGMLAAAAGSMFDYIVPVLVTANGYTPTAYLSKSGLDRVVDYTISAVTRFRERRPKPACNLCRERNRCIRLYMDLIA